MGEHPVKAVRAKRNATIVQAMEHLKKGTVSAVVSAGNSGAVMAAASLILGKKKGIDRPAIAGFLPAKNGPVLCLDLAANADCRATHLVQFAHMGAEYLRSVQGIADPKIGLLANGAEPGKGSSLVQETFALLQKSSLRFIGNIEPDALFSHAADIVVCDGFTGNILLKTFEICSALARKAALDNPLSSESNHSLVFGSLSTDAANEGGALLLGVEGTVIVAHGAADHNDMKHAICFAWNIVQESSNLLLEAEKFASAHMMQSA